jgi:hypothetical protein
MPSGGPAIAIGCLWVLIWLGIRAGVLPLPPRGRIPWGWRLPPTRRSARLLGYAGLALIGAGVVLVVLEAAT